MTLARRIIAFTPASVGPLTWDPSSLRRRRKVCRKVWLLVAGTASLLLSAQHFEVSALLLTQMIRWPCGFSLPSFPHLFSLLLCELHSALQPVKCFLAHYHSCCVTPRSRDGCLLSLSLQLARLQMSQGLRHVLSAVCTAINGTVTSVRGRETCFVLCPKVTLWQGQQQV